MIVPHSLQSRLSERWLARPSLYYGWVMLVLAAVAMTATLPGRTHGLGLIAKPLTEDASLNVDEVTFATLNFWAIIVGSALCLPAGRLVDRFGTRRVLAGVAACLGICVFGMSQAGGIVLLFVTLTLVRGLGQGALSVVSMAMVGKWFTRRLPIAMALFTVLLSIGFIASFQGFGAAVKNLGWRTSWAGLGIVLLVGLAPLALLVARSTPESIGAVPDGDEPESDQAVVRSSTLAEALRSPAFWAFTLSACLFNMIWSALTLLSENLLASRGFGHETYLDVMSMMVGFGLPANFFGGWSARRWGMGKPLAAGMAMLAGSLLAFPHLRTETHALLFGTMLGVAGGIVTVVFFAFYARAFGREHLGSIQAAAQVLTVVASALGPLLLALCRDGMGSYGWFFYATAPIALVLGVAVLLTPIEREAN